MLAWTTTAESVNMLAGSSRNRCLQHMKGDKLSFQTLQVSLFNHCWIFLLTGFKTQPEWLMVIFSFYIFVTLVCMNLRPVSLIRAAKTLMLTGWVSHSGRSRLSMTYLTIKPSGLALTADAEAVLY